MSSKDNDPSDADHSNGGRTKVAEKTNENSIMSENLNGKRSTKTFNNKLKPKLRLVTRFILCQKRGES